ncbi:MAG: peptide deformylase [Candidatus Omnitrophota bacterium]
MKDLDLTIYPDKILRKQLNLVEKVTREEEETLKKMFNLMHIYKGVGLAANQAGIDKQMSVIDLSDGYGPIYIINPKITKKEGTFEMEEGCLSIPGIGVKVKRAQKVTVEALNIEGKPIRIIAEGFLARALQHEIDHLSGKLIIDYLKLPARIKVISAFQKKKKGGK